MASSTLSDYSTVAPLYVQSLYQQLSSLVQDLSRQAATSGQRIIAHLPAPLLESISRPTSKTSLELLYAALLPLLVLLFSMASWRTYLNGRYSPFGAPATRSPPTVSEDDYAYLGPDDIVDPPRPQRTQVPGDSYGFPITSSRHPSRIDAATNPLAPDILILKHKGRTFPLHFPAFSIGEGQLRVRDVRQAAAKSTNSGDPRRVKLLYKGKILKDDGAPCREEGLKQNSELMCVITEGLVNGRGEGESSESADEEEMNQLGGGGVRIEVDGSIAGGSGGRRKKRKGHRGGAKRKGDSGTTTPHDPRDSGYLASDNYTSNPNSAPSTSRSNSPFPPSQPAPSRAAPPPNSSLAKIEDIASTFHTKFVPQCIQFMSNPPSELKTRDFEYKKLSESILAQIILKLDEVQTEGDDVARGRRKELVKETQALLNRLDAVGKR